MIHQLPTTGPNLTETTMPPADRGPADRRPTRHRPPRRSALDRFNDDALLVRTARPGWRGRPDGLTIVHRRYQLLVRTQRPHEQLAEVETELLDPVRAWQAEVHLVAARSDHLDAWFQIVPPDIDRPRPGTYPTTSRVPEAARHDHDRFLHDETEVLPAPPPNPDLILRLHQLDHPWDGADLRHVLNVIHAELHGCSDVTVRGRDLPTSRYYELPIATAKAGLLVRHAIGLNGYVLDHRRDDTLNLDAHSIDD